MDVDGMSGVVSNDETTRPYERDAYGFPILGGSVCSKEARMERQVVSCPNPNCSEGMVMTTVVPGRIQEIVGPCPDCGGDNARPR